MIGNDVVDLQQALLDSNWMRRGFINKLFTASEQQYIELAKRSADMVWLLWSMKEAAYKIYNKHSGVRTFAPLKLSCAISGLSATTCHGQVRVEAECYFTATTISPGDYIHSIAAGSAAALPQVRVQVLPNLPKIDYKAMQPACVSHHGRYLALIF
jgi:phosphopantetheinyl transferase (holo-ACP synthase)